MELKNIDLTNKCGSCCHFKPIEDTATGECLQNPYNDSVVHDPKHPHWIVQRSRIKCPLYNAKPQTNADRIRAMSDEKLAHFMAERSVNESTLLLLNKDHGLTAVQIEALKHNIYCACMQWLQQPAQEEL